ncbi:MAG TPA: hypothetical protein VMZ66_10705 [Aeromicrobium sp.]|nr:hypothetical protein [Aeromicrobium sp.]
MRGSGELIAVCQDSLLRAHILTTQDGQTWEIGEPSGIGAKDPNHVTMVTSIVEGSDGTLVIVGAEALDDMSSGEAAAWSSRDGMEWRRAPGSGSFEDGKMMAVVASTDGYLAVGADGFPGASVQLPGLRAPAVWRSTDATTWTRTSLPRGADRTLLEGVAPAAGGWAAWGGGPNPGSGAVWTSTDGDAWSLSANPAGARWGPIGRIVAAQDGSLVAVGSRRREGGDSLPGIWRSGDGGVTWVPVDLADAPGQGALWDVVATSGGLLATGAQGRVVASPDGSNWSLEPAIPPMPNVTMRLLISIAGSVVAFGSIDSEDATTAGIWRRDAGT